MPSRPGAPAAAWLATWLVLVAIGFIVVRSCAYDVRPLLAYGAYFAFHVWLPGIVVVAVLQRGPVSLTTAIALGVPTGFGIEIAGFLGLAALDAKPLVRMLPMVWVLGGCWLWRRRGQGLVHCRITRRHAGLALALSLVLLGTVVAAASHMFAESPLVAGLPQRPIYHDWVYLVSRAASIKHHWPLEDPSLAGSTLQYHYFLLVHVAAASMVTGVETSLILLRLTVVLLGVVLVVQTYALGRRVARTPWGGVIAAVGIVFAGEAALSTHPNHSVFLGRFVRWLYVSPTFFFGMIFFAAMLLAVMRWQALRRMDPLHVVWLAGLAALTTGAKGTVMPVLLVALAGWVIWSWARRGRFPLRLVAAGAIMTGAFAVVYQVTMAQWNTGAAGFAPFDIFRVSEFWQRELPRWTHWLAQWLPGPVAPGVAAVSCGLVVLAGTDGVRLLALPFVLMRHGPATQRWVEWLTAVWLGSAVMGLLMRLDADGQLYLFLLERLPSSVLAAAFLIEMARRLRRFAVAVDPPTANEVTWRGRGVAGIAICVVAAALMVQVAGWGVRNRSGWSQWLTAKPARVVDEDLLRLREAMLWVRQNTRRDAVLVANACTPENLRKDHWGALDGTLAGVHYYYSALSERRLLVEGPNYLLDPVRVSRRSELASGLFYRNRAVTARMLGGTPCYALLDRRVSDGARIGLPASARVFANARIEIYRLPRDASSSPRFNAAIAHAR